MARHFARLKLRLIRNGLRIGSAQIVALVLTICVAVPVAGIGFFLLAIVPRAEPDSRLPIAVMSFTAVFFGWLLAPLLVFGTDETLDPARLELLPLSRRQLMTGLLVSSTIGVTPLATLVALSGAVVGFATLGPGAVLVAAAVVVELLLCVSASRALITALARVLRSRRARDISVVVSVTLAVAFNAILQVGGRVLGNADRRVVDQVTDVLGWFPPGLVARSVVHAGDGDLLTATAELALGAGVVVVLLVVWARALDRMSTTAESTTTTTRAAGLYSGLLRFLPRTRSGVVAAKDLRYAWRDPRRRASLISIAPLACLPLASILFSPDETGTGVVFAALGAGGLFGIQSLNHLGMDGPPYWANVAAVGDIRADLTGKTIATVALGTLLSTIVAFVLAAFTGGWVYVPLVVILAVGLLLVETAVGNLTSVMAPQPVPEGSNPWGGGNAGQGCTASLITLAGMAVMVLVCVPVIVAMVVTLLVWRPGLVVVSVLTLVYGYVLWRASLGMAARRVDWRLPELLDAISPKRAG